MRLASGFAAAAIALMIAITISPASPARAAVTAEQAAAAIAKTYGVQVLKIAPAMIDGRAAYRITVMNPGGDFNDAFRVTTLAVDAETGKLISQFRHLASGYDLSGAPRYRPHPIRLDAAKSEIIWR